MINLDYLKEINLEDLNRNDLSVSLRFIETIPYIQRLVNSFMFFHGKQDLLMETDSNTLKRVFNEFTVVVQKILNFQSEPIENIQQTQNRRNKIIESVKLLDNNFTTYILPIYLRLKSQDDDKKLQKKIDDFDKIMVDSEKLINTKLSTFESNFNTTLNSFGNEISLANNTFKAKIADADKILSEAHDLKQQAENFSVENLVEKYGDIFSKQARANIKVALFSLFFFVIFLLATIYFAYRFFAPILENLATLKNDEVVRVEYIVTNIIFRLTLLGLLLVFVKEALKNFNINMRLYNLNRHRQNSLESFTTLISNVKGYRDDDHETRNHIIKEIAQTIYSNQEDGYLNKDRKNISIGEIADLIKVLKG